MEKAFTVKAIVPARLRVEENVFDRSLGIMYFGKDNAFPNRCRGYVNASGSAKPCVERFGAFMYGNGFRDINFAKAPVNKYGKTADDLLADICDDMAYHLGFYIHVNYNALFEIVSYKVIPYENVRYKAPDEGSVIIKQVAIYNDWGRKKDRLSISADDIEFIDLYNPNPAVIKRQVEAAGGWAKYKGQVYANPLGHALPIYDCVQEDLLTDAGIKTFKLSTVESGFAGSYIYVHKGKRPVKKDGDASNEIEEQIEEFQDPEAAGSILVVYAEKADQEPKLIPIEKNYDDKLHTITRKTTKEDIIGAFGEPPGLSQSQPGKLGTPEYNEAVEQYNFTTAKYRLRIERAIKELFKRAANPVLRVIPEGESEPNYQIEPVGGIQTGLGIKETLIPHYITMMGNINIPDPVKYASLINVFGMSETVAKTIIPAAKPDPNGPTN